MLLCQERPTPLIQMVADVQTIIFMEIRYLAYLCCFTGDAASNVGASADMIRNTSSDAYLSDETETQPLVPNTSLQRSSYINVRMSSQSG